MGASKIQQHIKLDLALIRDAIAIENEDAKSADALGYMARVLTQCTIPHRNPKTRFYKRTNGDLTITIADVNEVGMPYGSIRACCLPG
ncbi:MAG: hypothetical protein OXI59_01675 [Gemmatimonadota bacterium]|nr:hypothetical protein [Gemmatimonadota bacterium]